MYNSQVFFHSLGYILNFLMMYLNFKVHLQNLFKIHFIFSYSIIPEDFFCHVYSDCCLPILFSENILVFVLTYRSWFTLTNSLCGMIQGLNYILLHGYRVLLPPLTPFLIESKSQLLHIEMSLFKPKQNLSPSWWIHWQSLFLHFQLSDWHNCKLGSEEKNLSLFYIAGPSAGCCFFLCLQKQFRIHSSSPFLYLLHFQGISENFTPWFLSVCCNNPKGKLEFLLSYISTPHKYSTDIAKFVSPRVDVWCSLLPCYIQYSPLLLSANDISLIHFFRIKAWELLYLHIATLITSVLRKHSKLHLRVLFRTSPDLPVFPAYSVARCTAISCSAYSEDLQMTSFFTFYV